MSETSTHQQAANLPDNQRLALEALLQGGGQAEAAQVARASVRSIQRWMQDPVFVNALHQARTAAWMAVSGSLQARAQHAVDTLQAVMDCDRPHARVMAARAVLSLTLKAVELESIYERALQVEKDLDDHLARGGLEPGGGSNTGEVASDSQPRARASDMDSVHATGPEQQDQGQPPFGCPPCRPPKTWGLLDGDPFRPCTADVVETAKHPREVDHGDAQTGRRRLITAGVCSDVKSRLEGSSIAGGRKGSTRAGVDLRQKMAIKPHAGESRARPIDPISVPANGPAGSALARSIWGNHRQTRQNPPPADKGARMGAANRLPAFLAARLLRGARAERRPQ